MGVPVIAVVPAWNGRRWIGRCLASLIATDHPGLEIIVVDNGSQDDTAGEVARLFPQVTLLRKSRNLGFAEGSNVGIRTALRRGASYVAVINQDAWADPGWLSALLAAAEADPTIAVLTPEQYDYEGREFDPAFAVLMRGRAHQAGFVETDAIIGAAILLRRTMLERVGLFDPLYVAYFEEADLCRRARRAGFRTGVVPGSRVYHWHALAHPGQMSSRASYLSFRNQFVYELKDPVRTGAANLAAWLALCGREIARCLRHPRGSRGGLIRAAALGVSQAWVIANLPRILEHRAVERRGAAYL